MTTNIVGDFHTTLPVQKLMYETDKTNQQGQKTLNGSTDEFHQRTQNSSFKVYEK